MSNDRALERIRHILATTEALRGDFRHVRDDFVTLSRELRRELVESDDDSPAVLEAIFAGVDVIGLSEAGKSFDAFWHLLIDPTQRAALSRALDALLSRPFATQLSRRERVSLEDIPRTLHQESRAVYESRQSLVRNLKAFVDSQAFLEQRRINKLLQQAASAALPVATRVHGTARVAFSLEVPTARIASVSQAVLADPAERMLDATMTAAPPVYLSPADFAALLAQLDIDLKPLRQNIASLLADGTSVSIREVVNSAPLTDGLPTVVGYLLVGAEFGYAPEGLREGGRVDHRPDGDRRPVC